MSERWEYRLILWSSATKIEGEGTYPSGKSKRKVLFKNEFQIRGPGELLETRLGYSNHDEDADVETVKIYDLLNEYGAQGWELVSETVLDTTIVSNHAGWAKLGTPIEIRWILKRRVE